MEELKIDPISAHSPQAKGRVERLFHTLQDRLIKEFRLQNISDQATANQFLQKTFIKQFNTKFAKEPRRIGNRHIQLTPTEKTKLPHILSRQEERCVQNDYTISFNNQWFQIIKDQPVTIQKRDKVLMEKHLDQSIHIRLRGKYLNYELLPDWAKRAPGRKKQAKKIWFIPANNPNLGQAIGQLSRQIVKEHVHH